MRCRFGARLRFRLTPCEDGVQPRLKIFLSLGSQFAALDRKRRFDGFHPIEQLLDVFAGLGVIFLQVAVGRHPLAERVFEGVVRRAEWVGGAAGIEQAAMASETAVESTFAV